MGISSISTNNHYFWPTVLISKCFACFAVYAIHFQATKKRNVDMKRRNTILFIDTANIFGNDKRNLIKNGCKLAGK